MKKFKGKIILFISVIILLSISYIWGGNIPKEKDIPETKVSNIYEDKKEFVAEKEEKENDTDNISENTKKPKDEQKEENNFDEKELKPQNTEDNSFEENNVCKMYISCGTVLNNMDLLDKEKSELIPKEGIIYENENVVFYEGESVFNVLLRETKENKIHLEFVKTPVYNSVYIEGINNLYEFDCGELSGWVYKVNGYVPNYGCSLYKLKNGDVIEWLYTCDLGKDVGGYNNIKKEQEF